MALTEEEIVILARLAGKSAFVAGTAEMGGSMGALAAKTELAGDAMVHTSRKSYLMNQALFTTRRMIYSVTLVMIGAGLAAVKLGNDFNAAMQGARVALDPFFNSSQDLEHSLDRLWKIAAFTPFRIKDMTLAFRSLYPSLHSLGISADETIDTLAALIDGLSVAGKISGPALQRITIALQHVAFQGRLTGRSINQLAADGIPIFDILSKELGVTGDQLHQVAKLGIPAGVVMRAITHYMQTTPGYAGAAFRQSTETFEGIWSTFVDYVSRASGILQLHFRKQFQGQLSSVNEWFTRLFEMSDAQGGRLSATDIIGTISPQAAVLWRVVAQDVKLLWQYFTSLVKAFLQFKPLWIALYGFLVLLRTVLRANLPLVQNFTNLLYILVPLIIAWKIQTWALIFAIKSQAFWTAVTTGAVKDLTFVQWLAALMTGRFQVAVRLATAAQKLWTLSIVLTSRAMIFLRTQMAIMATVALLRFARNGMLAARAMLFLRTAMATLTVVMMLNPIIAITVAVVALVAGLVILYYKWKWFHNLVDETWRFMMKNAPYVAAALTVAFGPLGIALATVLLLIKYWHKLEELKDRGKDKAGFLHRITQGTVLPSFASGGTMPWSGAAWVGEQGPELALLPAGTKVLDNKTSSQFRPQEAWAKANNGARQPIIVNLVLNDRVLEQIMVEAEADRVARA